MTDNAPKRFDPTTNGNGAVWMEPDEWGEYVSYSDYTALVAERDRLRKEYDDFIGETWDREKTFARKMGALEEALTSVLAWHDKDKHTSGKMTFERSAAFAKARAALQETKP